MTENDASPSAVPSSAPIVLEPSFPKLLARVPRAKRVEVFSTSCPNFVRSFLPGIKEAAKRGPEDALLLRVSLLLPWSPMIREHSRKEIEARTPTRKSDISLEVIGNFGEFLYLPRQLPPATGTLTGSFECYDCPNFFQYYLVEDDEGVFMRLTNYTTFTKGVSTPPVPGSSATETARRHYDDAQRILSDFGVPVAKVNYGTGGPEVEVLADIARLNEKSVYRVAGGQIRSSGPAELVWSGSAGRPPVDVFVAYADKDRAQAQHLVDVLEKERFRVFLASESLFGGQEWTDEIRRALISAQVCIVLATEASIQSVWVTSEWTIQWLLGRPVMPVLLGIDAGRLPTRLQQYHALDFVNTGRIVADVRKHLLQAESGMGTGSLETPVAE